MKVPCICIDDANRPESIPISKWVKKEEKYNITHVYIHPLQEGGVQGVSLYEKPLDESCAPYESFRITRFAFTEEGLQMLKELMALCSELDRFDIEELLESTQLEIHE